MPSLTTGTADGERLGGRLALAVAFWLLVLILDALFLDGAWIFALPLFALHFGLPLALRRAHRDWCGALLVTGLVSLVAWTIALVVFFSLVSVI